MEDCRPDEGEHAPGEADDEAHQDGEVRNDDCKHDGHDDNQDPEPEAPHLEFAVQGPDRWEDGGGFALKKFTFQNAFELSNDKIFLLF